MSIDWREHSAGIAKGEKCPDTLETLQAAWAAWARDQELILDQKAEISRLKETVNQLRQRRCAHIEAGARILHWKGPKHMPVPRMGVCARTYAEYPKDHYPDGYWSEGEELYLRELV